MVQINDLSRSLAAFDPISTLVVVVEMSKASWLVSGVVPGVERQPLKKLEPDATALLRLIERWRSEAMRAGRPIRRGAAIDGARVRGASGRNAGVSKRLDPSVCSRVAVLGEFVRGFPDIPRVSRTCSCFDRNESPVRFR